MYIVNVAANRDVRVNWRLKLALEGLALKGDAVADFVGAVDQGTTSTRFMIFDQGGAEVARHQLEHTQIMPRPGWVEHDPAEIWERTRAVIETALRESGLHAADLAAVGRSNQRETTLVWNRHTG